MAKKTSGNRKRKKDLFADLWDRPRHDVENDAKELKRRKIVIEQEFESVRGERQRQIRIAQAIRGVIIDTKNIRSEHKGIINKIGERESLIRDLRDRRDAINERVVLPLKNIENELQKTYRMLTEERTDMRYPSVEEEERLFSFFFELQAMHPLMKESSKLHNERISLIEEQREAIKALRAKEAEHDQVVDEAKSADPKMRDLKATPWEEKAYNRRIAKLLEEQKGKRSELKNLSREIGRLDAFLRVDRKNREKGAKSKRFGRKMVDVNEARRKAESGESMSLQDLTAILDSGGFDSLKSKQTSDSKRKKKSKSKKKFGASRGSSRSGKPARDE